MAQATMPTTAILVIRTSTSSNRSLRGQPSGSEVTRDYGGVKAGSTFADLGATNRSNTANPVDPPQSAAVGTVARI
jgi:hypothetical protein